MSNLRPYQEQAIANIHDNLKQGVNKQLLVLATGLGKTKTAVTLVERLGFKRVLWITHTEELVEQSALAFIKDKFDNNFAEYVEEIGFINWVMGAKGVFGINEPQFKMGIIKASDFYIDADVTIASAQTLYRRLDKVPDDYFDCIITDECFPKGTLVDGRPIEEIKIGDIVNSFNHNTHKTERKKVVRLFKKEVKSDLYKIMLENGVEFICTEEHPIYTKEFGYIQAKSICKKQVSCLYLQNERIKISKRNKNKLSRLFKRGDYNKSCKQKGFFNLWKSILFTRVQEGKVEKDDKNIFCTMQNVWKRVIFYYEAGKINIFSWNYLLQKIRFSKNRFLLQKEKERGYEDYETKNRLQENVSKNEGEQSDVKPRNSSKNDKFNEGKNISISWWKRRVYKTSNDVTFSNWIRYGIRYQHDACKRIVYKFTNLLQSRFGCTGTETCNRSGWKDSQIKEVEVFRQEKNRNFKFVRVESCEIYKRRDRTERGESDEKTYVYNIEVEDNHNYFVENTLVHNCHLFMAKTYVQPLNYFKPKLLLGLTATPHRMDGLSLGDVYDKIVFEYNIGEGVRDKYLCELDGIRIKTDLSLDNVRTTAGELNSSDLSNEINIPKRNKLIVDSYLKYASEKQGIFFCADVKHALDLSEMFNEYGISSKPVVSDKDITTNRKGVIADYKSGELQVLTNVTILTTGFDHPDTGVIGMASPTKSLTKYLQSIGRGTRLKSNEYVDKYGQVCTILDFVDTSSRHKLINTWTLDSGKATEDKLFLTEAQKKELIEERLRKQAKVDAMYKHDERIILLQLPDIIKFKSDKMKEPATPAQLKWLNDLGYDIINNNFTKQMCSDIIGMQPCNQKEIEYLKSKGYDTQFATKGHYSTVYFEHELKGKKWK